MFTNPTVSNPVQAQEIIKQLDVEFMRPLIDKMYAEAYRFKFDPISVFKTMIYWRLKRHHRFLTELFGDLIMDPTLADTLGYDSIPSYQQLYHFMIYRLNAVGTKMIFDKLLKHVICLCMLNDIEVGKEIVIDSSPFEKKNNKDATFNKHYNMTGYNWYNVRCVETDLPLEYHVSTFKEYDDVFPAELVKGKRNFVLDKMAGTQTVKQKMER